MRKLMMLVILMLMVLLVGVSAIYAQHGCQSDTVVPGQCGRDGTVVGHYTTEAGGYTYIVNFRGDFGGDPYLDSGRIMNVIRGGPGEVYMYQIVSEGSPQYDGDNPVWGTWDYHVLVVSGEGNVARPDHPVGNQ